MEQPPNPMTETPCQHATSRDASHSSMHGQGFLPRSAASTEGNRGPVTRKVVRCREGVGTGGARGTKQSIRPMARSHSLDGTGGVPLKSSESSEKSAKSSGKDMGLQVTDKVKTAGKRGSKETDNARGKQRAKLKEALRRDLAASQ